MRLNSYLQKSFQTKGLSINVQEIPFVEDETCGCQCCEKSFDCNDVMIVDNVGPICFRCLHNLAEVVLTGGKIRTDD